MKKNTLLAALFALPFCINAAVFSFEDVSETYDNTTSGFFSYGMPAKTTQVSTSAGGVSGSIHSISFYNDSTWESFGGGGAVTASASKIAGYDHDLDSASGGASSGSKYAVLFLPTADTFYGGQRTNSYNGGYNNAYCTWLTGKNSAFDNTFSDDLDGYGLDGDVAKYMAPASFTIDGGVRVNFESIDLSLTALTYDRLDASGLDDNYMGKSNIHTKTDGIFVIRIYGIIDAAENLLTDNYVDWVAGMYVDGVNDFLAEGWEMVSLASLNVEGGLQGLAFQEISSFGSNGAMGAPAYIALDNIAFAAIPEFSEVSALFGSLILLFVIVRKRKRN